MSEDKKCRILFIFDEVDGLPPDLGDKLLDYVLGSFCVNSAEFLSNDICDTPIIVEVKQ